MKLDPLDVGEIVAHQGFVRSLARGLVGDPAGAEDLVQETYLHVLERKPARPLRLRAWLGRVVANLARDRQRADARRVARELAAPATNLPGAIGANPATSTAGLVQRMELHRRLVERVLALDPAQREVVLLHYFEELTVAATAERLGIPLETARTRLRRALATLRDQLDRELGGREAALAALLPLARLALPNSAGAAVAAATTGAAAGAAAYFGAPLVMTTTTKLSLAAASLLFVGGVLLFKFGGTPIPARDLAARGEQGDALARPATADGATTTPTPEVVAAERAPIATPPPATNASGPLSPAFGALRIKTTWKESGLVAPHIHVRLVPGDGAAQFPAMRRAETDDAGELLLRDLAPGVLTVAVAGFDASQYAEGETCVRDVPVVAGESGEVVLALPAKFEIVGDVVDAAGKPIGGAEIWVGDRGNSFSDGVVATRTDERGEFELPAVGMMHFIAARAPGYALSEAFHPTWNSTGRHRSVHFVLARPGATLLGRVVDPERKPVAHALVVLDLEEGTSMLLENGTIQERSPPRITHSDADGLFLIDAIAPGPVVVAVRADGFPTMATKLTLAADPANSANEHEFRLRVGAKLFGTVKDAGGVPAAGATLHALAFLGARLFQLAEFDTVADAAGAFELAQLPPGEMDLRVDAGALGSLRRDVALAEGATQRLDLVVTCGAAFRGRVVDELGHPIASARVEALPTRGAPRIPPPVISDADGRFEIPDCAADVDWRLQVFEAQESFLRLLAREPVRPGDDEITLVIGAEQRPTADIRGRFVDPDGRPVVALVHLFQENSNSIGSFSARPNGSFATDDLPPSRYSLWASSEGFAAIETGWHELHPDEKLDLGELRFAKPAAVVIHVDRGEGFPLDASNFTLRSPKSGAATLVLAGGDLRATGLAPGDYTLDVTGLDLARQQLAVTCKAGETTTLDVRLEGGVTRKFTISRADGAALGGKLTWTASDPNGRELHGTVEVAPDAKTAELSLCLSVGDWSLEITTADGARAETTFVASRRSSDGEPVLLTLPR